jgi:type II secretory pathway component PulF
MAQFQYRATDAEGRQVDGQVEASDSNAASTMLASQGLTQVEVTVVKFPAPVNEVAPGRLQVEDTEELLGHFAQVSMSLAPLSDGLRAAATEATNHRVSSALRYLAAEIEHGRRPEEVLADPTLRMPSHVRGIVASAIRTGRLGSALDELIEHHRSFRLMFWSIVSSVAYPLIVLCMALVVLLFVLIVVVPPFETLFEDFQLRLPAATTTLMHASKTTTWLVFSPAKWVLFIGLLAMLVVMYLTASGRGGARAQRLFEMMPVVGPLWSWAGASSFMHLLATLLEQDIPLPEALRYAADGMKKADLREAGVWLALGIERGQLLSDLVESSSCLPMSSVPVLRWGEKTSSLAEAARSLSTLFADRVTNRTAWLRSASPPFVYLFIVTTLGFAITSLFMPIISLIQSLT